MRVRASSFLCPDAARAIPPGDRYKALVDNRGATGAHSPFQVLYQALGKPATGRVTVKISTEESAQSNQLCPKLTVPLVKEINGTLVECNTVYNGNRSNTASHRRAIEQRGYARIATVDIMDEEGYMNIPVSDTQNTSNSTAQEIILPITTFSSIWPTSKNASTAGAVPIP